MAEAPWRSSNKPRKFRVVFARRKPVVIEAEYVRIDDGHLVFRNTVRNCYPLTVAAYAPGQWAEFADITDLPVEA